DEGIDYDEVFSLVAKIKAIRIFLAFASYMGFIVYQIDVKSAFLYDTIDEEVYVTQPPGFVDPKFSNKVYNVVKALYGLHQAPRACVKTASTPIETQKPLVKDEEAADVDVHLYRDAYEKKLIQVLKIHTDDDVADLLTKAFDVSMFNFLVVNIRLLNL
nr:putative ribonuclease H-like domain-containing protein [Tanacetum cinerariifolium]